MTDFTAFPIANVTIPSLPDLGGVTDASMLVGERAGTGRFAATALRSYVMQSGTFAGDLHVTGALTADGGIGTTGHIQAGTGTFTGDFQIDGALSVQTSVTAATGYTLSLGGAFWAMDGAGTYFVFDNSNYRLLYERGNGRLSYMRSDDVDLWNVDSAGNCTIHGTLSSSTGSFLVSGPGNVTTGGSIAASGSIASNSIIESASDVFARGGHYWFGNADQAVLSTTAAGTSLRFSADGWALSWSASAGTLGFFNNSAQPIFTVDHSGNGTFLGTVHGTNVTALEDRIALLEARIAALGG